MEKVKIAIVEYDVSFRESFASLMINYGFVVNIKCNNGAELISILNTANLPDIVLINPSYEVNDASETTLWLKKNYPFIHVVGFGFFPNEQSFRKMIKNGAKGHISRKITPDDFNVAIRSILRGRYFFDKEIGSVKSITERELKILEFVSSNKTIDEIAELLSVTRKTVLDLRYNLFRKFEVTNDFQLILTGISNNFIHPTSVVSEREHHHETFCIDDTSKPEKEFLEDVYVSIYAPRKAQKGQNVLLQAFAHTNNQVQEVANIAKEVDEDAGHRITNKLESKLSKTSEIEFNLLVPGMQVDRPVQSFKWKNEIIKVQFELKIPLDFESKSIIVTLIVSENSIPIGHLKFKLKIIPASSLPASDSEVEFYNQMHRYHQAFISYASKDRNEVLKRVQMLNLVKLQFFQDLLTLEPGDKWEKLIYEYIDKSDVFFLFWSEAASKSKWVEKEVKYAFDHKHGIKEQSPEIIPVIIEGPPPAPPPVELNFLHFNDKFIYFINSDKQ